MTAIRIRYDGRRRNPWNEFECGSNYARSMASYALLLTFSGFQYEMSKKHIGFEPVDYPGAPKNLSYFWSLDCAWGSFEYDGSQALVCVTEGELILNTFMLPKGVLMCFDNPVTVRAGGKLTFRLNGNGWRVD